VYRPEIDGLRAVAVLAVVFHHAKLSCPGGFVGVDVFFVLSGFLISTLILHDLEEGRFSLTGFWERRIRRIAPALGLMVLATLGAGFFLLLPGDYRLLGNSSIAQALMGANVFFMQRAGGYFGGVEIHPLLHTWSLAVEEQFYLLFPVVLMLVFQRRLLSKPGALRLLLFALWMTSFLLATVSLYASPGFVFYMLPARAWELLCGALLVVMPRKWHDAPRLLKEVSAWAGLAGILFPVWIYWGGLPFPGLLALPPCLGTMAVIWANTPGEGGKIPTSAGRLLALRPFVLIGLVSYSLYLWHWPLFIFHGYGMPSVVSIFDKLGMAALSGWLAVLSWRYVEIPFRKRQIAGSRAGIFGVAAVLMLTVLVSGWIIRNMKVSSPQIILANAAAADDRNGLPNVTIEDIRAGRVPEAGSSRNDGEAGADNPARLLLWGDSHAKHTVAALEVFCREAGIVADIIVSDGTPPLIGKPVDGSFLGEKSTEWADAVLQHIEKANITHVLMVARWGYYERSGADRLEPAIRETVHRLDGMGRKVAILLNTPDLADSAPRRLDVRRGQSRWRDTGWRETLAGHRRKNSIILKLAAAPAPLPALFLDPIPRMVLEDSDYLQVEVDGISLYYDDTHLTTRGAKIVLLPLFRDSLPSFLSVAPQAK
jgi:peptidoglycan/LPS O-acetylase OafA/YrhL